MRNYVTLQDESPKITLVDPKNNASPKQSKIYKTSFGHKKLVIHSEPDESEVSPIKIVDSESKSGAEK